MKGDKNAKLVYPFRKLGNQLRATLLIVAVLLSTTFAVLMSRLLNPIIAIMFVSLVVLSFSEIIPRLYIGKLIIPITAQISPLLHWIVIVTAPLAKPLGRLFDSLSEQQGRTFYTKAEIFKLLDAHAISDTSDVNANEIEIVRHALSFSEKQVRSIMTPRRMVVSVKGNDLIGPVVINELHNSGHSRFPVTDDKDQEKFTGILYLKDLLGVRDGGTVKDFMRKQVYYVHEEQTLNHALDAFLKTNHHLLVVVNTFEEFVGVLSIEDVIEQIIGRQIVDEFDQHADLRAVAQSLADKEVKQRTKSQQSIPL